MGVLPARTEPWRETGSGRRAPQPVGVDGGTSRVVPPRAAAPFSGQNGDYFRRGTTNALSLLLRPRYRFGC
jgi:hypothetical protein